MLSVLLASEKKLIEAVVETKGYTDPDVLRGLHRCGIFKGAAIAYGVVFIGSIIQECYPLFKEWKAARKEKQENLKNEVDETEA